MEWIVQLAVFSASIHQSQFHRASCIALRMLICPGSSIAWMSTQSYDDDYEGDDDDKSNQQEFRAGNIRSLICFSLIKAPSRKGTRLRDFELNVLTRHAAFGRALVPD